LNILQVNTADTGGGAERVVYNLLQAYSDLGHNSWLAVGAKRSNHSAVFEICNSRFPAWTSFCRSFDKKLESVFRKAPRLWRVAPFLEHPPREIKRFLGIEVFDYPGSRRIAKLPPQRPDVIHYHNLHDGYFDLRALPRLSRETPAVFTLHDAWLLSGHCAHSFDCDRWKTGCGSCPNLGIYPSIERDATAYNWRQKQKIFAQSRCYVSTPSQWLMSKVQQSILAPAVVEARVVHNGVDLRVFKPGDRESARRSLGISPNTRIVLFSANGIKRNIWRDYETLRKALTLVAEQPAKHELLFIALGEIQDTPDERIGHAKLRFIPHQKDPQKLIPYNQAADVYIHASRADTFPNTVLEALACGVPVVATAVGGIPEQVKGLAGEDHILPELNRYGADQATGALVPLGDAQALAGYVQTLLTDEPLRRRIADNAAQDARERFDLKRQTGIFLSWYEDLLGRAGKFTR